MECRWLERPERRLGTRMGRATGVVVALRHQRGSDPGSGQATGVVGDVQQQGGSNAETRQATALWLLYDNNAGQTAAQAPRAALMSFPSRHSVPPSMPQFRAPASHHARGVPRRPAADLPRRALSPGGLAKHIAARPERAAANDGGISDSGSATTAGEPVARSAQRRP